MIQLSEHFTLREAMFSRVAESLKIDNTPPVDLMPVLIRTAEGMEMIRAFLGAPIQVQSWYRCPELNKAVGGAKNSQHMLGEAVDFICTQFKTPRAVARAIATLGKIEEFGVDQLILEPTWVHVSFSLKPRGQALTIRGSVVTEGIA